MKAKPHDWDRERSHNPDLDVTFHQRPVPDRSGEGTEEAEEESQSQSQR